jgi:hypothetical protein
MNMAKSIQDIIRATGLRPIPSTWRQNKNDEANEMIGRHTFYYSPDTMRYFGCRVQQVAQSPNGAYMWTIARQDRNSEGRKAYVVTFHAFDGYCLPEADGDRVYHNTLAQAEKHRDELLAGMDEMQVVAEAVKRLKRDADRASANARKAYNMLPKAMRN